MNGLVWKVISGGQTGADHAGLRAAKDSGINTGGTAPRNFMTEEGSKPELEIEFDSFSVGATKVTDVSVKSIVCLLEREYWIHPAGHERALRLFSFGGLSGGPAFIFRSIISEFVGIIYEYSKNYDYFLLSRVNSIEKDGKIAICGS